MSPSYIAGEGRSSLLISTDPIKLTAEWKCQDSACGQKLSAAEMIRLHKELRNAKELLEESYNFEDHRAFLEKQLGPEGLLHVSSTYVLQTKIFLIFNVLGHAPGYLLNGRVSSGISMLQNESSMLTG